MSKTYKTLVVDDERASGCSIRRWLEQQGHETVLVENGVTAWQRLRTETFALVIADWLMPEMDGIELARRIRARSDSGVTYIILLSSRDSRENRQAAFDAGVDDILTRPTSLDEIYARIKVAERIQALQTDLGAQRTQLARNLAEMDRIESLNSVCMNEIREACRDLELANAQLKAKSITDGLTGLKNHREFQERLEDEISRASRYHLPLSLIMLDVDHFKLYNDAYGHPAGDEVLKKLALLLENHAREADVIARYGGEEFAMILANTDREHAIAAAERFRTAVEQESWPHQPITVSMGVSTLLMVPQSRTDLTSEADTALYSSKNRGRNCVSHFLDVRETA